MFSWQSMALNCYIQHFLNYSYIDDHKFRRLKHTIHTQLARIVDKRTCLHLQEIGFQFLQWYKTFRSVLVALPKTGIQPGWENPMACHSVQVHVNTPNIFWCLPQLSLDLCIYSPPPIYGFYPCCLWHVLGDQVVRIHLKSAYSDLHFSSISWAWVWVRFFGNKVFLEARSSFSQKEKKKKK